MPARLSGLAPIIDAGVTTLILGSFPSVASLGARRYYAHPRNQFWPILGALLGEPLAELPYAERLRRTLAHRVGIWDIHRSCVRPGSLDADIAAASGNDLEALRIALPRLRAVAFNGRAAGRREPDLRPWGVATAVLPSTSPAHAGMSLERKLGCWDAFFSVHHAADDGDRRLLRTA